MHWSFIRYHARSSRDLATTTAKIWDGQLCDYYCHALHFRCLLGSWLHLSSSIFFHLFFVVFFSIFWTVKICFKPGRLEKRDVFSNKSNTSSHTNVFYFRYFEHIYCHVLMSSLLTLSWRRSILYRNQSIDLQCNGLVSIWYGLLSWKELNIRYVTLCCLKFPNEQIHFQKSTKQIL